MKTRVWTAVLCLVSLFMVAGCGGSSSGAGNRAPVITNQTTISGNVDPGEVIALSVTATDADGNALAYAWSCTAGSLSSTSGSSTEWTAPASGSATVTVRVTDGKGGTDETSWTITVGTGPVDNSDPVITDKTSYTYAANPDQDILLEVTATDADGDPLTYTWSCTDGTLSTTTGSSTTWTSPPRSASPTITVEVTDGRGGSTQATWNILVASTFEGTWYYKCSDGHEVTVVVGDLISRKAGYEFYAGQVTTSVHPGEIFYVTSEPTADQMAYENDWTNVIYTGGSSPFLARAGSWTGAMVKWQAFSVLGSGMTGEIAICGDDHGVACYTSFVGTRISP